MIGSMHAESFSRDPKHLAFVLARYHFVARMLEGKQTVLEVGCGDGTGAQIVRQVVPGWFGVDLKDYGLPSYCFHVHDMLSSAWGSRGAWQAVYSLDVLEHIQPEDEDKFLGHIKLSRPWGAPVIIGMPSLESQAFASEESRKHHVNCKTGPQLRETLGRHFANVFMFGMNDTTLHIGKDEFCNYRLAICT